MPLWPSKLGNYIVLQVFSGDCDYLIAGDAKLIFHKVEEKRKKEKNTSPSVRVEAAKVIIELFFFGIV